MANRGAGLTQSIYLYFVNHKDLQIKWIVAGTMVNGASNTITKHILGFYSLCQVAALSHSLHTVHVCYVDNKFLPTPKHLDVFVFTYYVTLV